MDGSGREILIIAVFLLVKLLFWIAVAYFLVRYLKRRSKK